jgi:hypothetical protein
VHVNTKRHEFPLILTKQTMALAKVQSSLRIAKGFLRILKRGSKGQGAAFGNREKLGAIALPIGAKADPRRCETRHSVRK